MDAISASRLLSLSMTDSQACQHSVRPGLDLEQQDMMTKLDTHVMMQLMLVCKSAQQGRQLRQMRMLLLRSRQQHRAVISAFQTSTEMGWSLPAAVSCAQPCRIKFLSYQLLLAAVSCYQAVAQQPMPLAESMPFTKMYMSTKT